ncbi:hypothetical protein SPSINT_2237 [Staphylococcus pseudintermedius HKU10-03]|nr:hypothetical protein SPSINT_2237 [Staphylococcus pseudintermedius HKU10-03]
MMIFILMLGLFLYTGDWVGREVLLFPFLHTFNHNLTPYLNCFITMAVY